MRVFVVILLLLALTFPLYSLNLEDLTSNQEALRWAIVGLVLLLVETLERVSDQIDVSLQLEMLENIMEVLNAPNSADKQTS